MELTEEEGIGALSHVRDDLYNTVERILKIACHFHRATVSNDKLQAYVQQEMENEPTPILDSRTRWNGLAFMGGAICAVAQISVQGSN